jgi:hypothetical protein
LLLLLLLVAVVVVVAVARKEADKRGLNLAPPTPTPLVAVAPLPAPVVLSAAVLWAAAVPRIAPPAAVAVASRRAAVFSELRRESGDPSLPALRAPRRRALPLSPWERYAKSSRLSR